MEKATINETALQQHLTIMAGEIGERPPGSQKNKEAVAYVAQVLQDIGWEVQLGAFECIDWEPGSVHLEADGQSYEAFASPYSLGCQVSAQLVVASTMDELQTAQVEGNILLLAGQLASEQIMPKNFVFYNPEEHRELIALLEEKSPLAIICTTGLGRVTRVF